MAELILRLRNALLKTITIEREKGKSWDTQRPQVPVSRILSPCLTRSKKALRDGSPTHPVRCQHLPWAACSVDAVWIGRCLSPDQPDN